MPRLWLAALLFALALAVQALAPAANGVAAAHGFDALGLGEICLRAAQSGRDSQPAPRRTHGHHDCVLCQAFCDGATPVMARLVAIAAPRTQWTLSHWTAAPPGLTANPRNFWRQARAPPAFA